MTAIRSHHPGPVRRVAYLAAVCPVALAAGALKDPAAASLSVGRGDLCALLADTPARAAQTARRLARRGPALPGGRRATFAGSDDRALRAAAGDWLAAQAPIVAAWLEDLGERSEFVISLRAERAAAGRAGYLARRAAETRRLRAASAEILGSLRHPASAQSAGADSLDLSVLWPRDDAAGFAAALAPLVRAYAPALRLRASGPWPAYSFALEAAPENAQEDAGAEAAPALTAARAP